MGLVFHHGLEGELIECVHSHLPDVGCIRVLPVAFDVLGLVGADAGDALQDELNAVLVDEIFDVVLEVRHGFLRELM